MNISGFLVDTITWSAYTGPQTGAKGDPAYGSPSDIKARVERGAFFVTTSSGEEISAAVRLAVVEDVKVGDRIWLAGADTSKASESRTVRQVERAADGRGGYLFSQVYL